MRLWDLETSSAQLRDAMEELQLAWEETSEHWDDSVSDRFREEHLEPIAPAMKLALDAVACMNNLLNQVYRECES
ncbi:MAG: hypothetical protein AAGA92_02870 [Planctomycetota bacterium]